MHSYISKTTKMTKESPTCPSERLVEIVITSITVLDGVMADVAHTQSVKEKITGANKNIVDFGWIHSSGCLIDHQQTVGGIARSVTRIPVSWWCK